MKMICTNWPIGEFLSNDLDEQLVVRFTTPAHKALFSASIKNGLYDLPYIPKTVLKESEIVASKKYETKATYYFPTGVSYAVLAGLHAAFNKKERVLVGRNIHKSILSGLALLDIQTDWICPQTPWFVFEPDYIQQAIDNTPNVSGLILNNPSYEGHITNISTISRICKKRGLKLIIDESLGSHWVGKDFFPPSAISYNVDIVFHSLHKRVGSLVPAALMHLPKNSILDNERVEQYVNIFRSTSPSNIVLASTESTIEEHFSENSISSVRKLVYHCREFKNDLMSLQDSTTNKYLFEMQDPFTFHFLPKFGNPIDIAETLYDHGIDYEHVDERGVIFFFSKNEKFSHLDFLKNSIVKIMSNYSYTLNHIFSYHIPKIQISPGEAFNAKSERIELNSQAIGRTAIDIIAPCPPGIPVLIPGERIQKWHLKRLKNKYIRVVR